MITINGKTYHGSNISVVNNKVTVDGISVDLEGTLALNIVGDVRELKADCCKTIEVKGVVHQIATQSGDVTCGDVAGSIQTMSGDVDCGGVQGSVTTMSGKVITRTRG